MEIRILDFKANLTRHKKIQLIIGQRFERVQEEKEKAGLKAFAAVGNEPAVQCQLSEEQSLGFAVSDSLLGVPTKY